MFLSYDVVKYILEIKYKNWIKEKVCMCGYEDFKQCCIFECYECPNNYCEYQKGITKWIWECEVCLHILCGEHEYNLINYKKVCSRCVGKTFKKPIANRLKTVPVSHLLALELRNNRFDEQPQ